MRFSHGKPTLCHVSLGCAGPASPPNTPSCAGLQDCPLLHEASGLADGLLCPSPQRDPGSRVKEVFPKHRACPSGYLPSTPLCSTVRDAQRASAAQRRTGAVRSSDTAPADGCEVGPRADPPLTPPPYSSRSSVSGGRQPDSLGCGCWRRQLGCDELRVGVQPRGGLRGKGVDQAHRVSRAASCVSPGCAFY